MDFRLPLGSRVVRVEAEGSAGLDVLRVPLLVSLCALALASSGASADGSTTATINVGVRSIQVAPGHVVYESCLQRGTGASTLGFLSFPNGTCTTAAITVTNGTAPSHIVVLGADANPVNAGSGSPPWALCSVPTQGGPACTGPNSLPGTDQFDETLFSLATNLAQAPLSSHLAVCDPAINPLGDHASPARCAALPHQSATELVRLDGPHDLSTVGDSAYTTTVTWIAQP